MGSSHFAFGARFFFDNKHVITVWAVLVVSYTVATVARGGGLMSTALAYLFPRKMRVATVRTRHKVWSLRASAAAALGMKRGDFGGDDGCEARPSRAPPLNVCLLVTGTHGDVAPFVALGLELVRRHGHRVRLATHACYRKKVTESGLEFYPLAGDPRTLSQWMVQSQGRLLPQAKWADLKEIPAKKEMISAIMRSCLDACVDRDFADPVSLDKPRFVAHAVVANPVAYGHFHVAEALKVPLLMAFPQPWTPTASFPHPLASLSNDAPTTMQQRRLNEMSFRAVETLQWQGLDANPWRERALGLKRLDVADRGASLLDDFDVPFAYTWSPALCPRQKEWGSHIDVLGALTLAAKDDGGAAYKPEDAVAAFLAASAAKPVFVGFGSMVIADPGALYDLILDAAEASETRVIVQSSWSKIDGDRTSPYLCTIGPCPHSWLMPLCGAVVHHGGAGTVAAGLRRGLPTLVCPFFGDQHFWGECCRRAGVGPPPVPIQRLTSDLLARAFAVLRHPATAAAAAKVGDTMRAEDGVGALCDVIEKRLPAHDMTCQVSLFAASEPTVVVAEVWHPSLGCAISAEAHAALDRDAFAVPYAYVLWDTGEAVLGTVAKRGAMALEISNHCFASLLSLACLGLDRVATEAYADWRRRGGRPNRLGLAAYLVVATVLAALEAPLKFALTILDIVVGQFLVRFVLFETFRLLATPFARCMAPRGAVDVPVRAHGAGDPRLERPPRASGVDSYAARARVHIHRHRYAASALDADRVEDLRRAASTAKHTFDALSVAAATPRPRILTRDQAVGALVVLLARPPPLFERKARSIRRGTLAPGLGALDRRANARTLRRPTVKGKYAPIAAVLLDRWFPDKPAKVPVVDFCLNYARHLRDAPLPRSSDTTSLEMSPASVC